ncbi:MAG: glycerol-3-phosphate acyltransferase [Candidatus Pacebacteria bacterium]|nr:glycerol-3-phosphate acyltransferase [Candidatus Paceibacterota bacterium]MDD5013192.1 glycerol-3-phosphate acyltransferase [Candidatus Paceibacterota bacterium]MDD5752666.1 glycerol-3-phosphate acyltransferase [Candidatus Paceibacterota bacterium]
MINYIFIILFSYLLGSIPFALVVNKLFFKQDIRTFGSKNMGALNTLRTASKEKGKLIGLISFIAVTALDMGKAILSIIIAQILFPNSILAITLASFFVILGHNYSIFLKLKGGRGAASFLGILLYLDWKSFLVWILIIVFFMVLFELMAKRKINKKFLKHAVSDQVLGRLTGETIAVLWFYAYNTILFFPALFVTPLILIAHKDRLKEQLEKIKNKTYLND